RAAPPSPAARLGLQGTFRTAVEEAPERIAGAPCRGDDRLRILDKTLQQLTLPGTVQLVGLRVHPPEIGSIARRESVAAQQRLGFAGGDLGGLRLVGIQ